MKKVNKQSCSLGQNEYLSMNLSQNINLLNETGKIDQQDLKLTKKQNIVNVDKRHSLYESRRIQTNKENQNQNQVQKKIKDNSKRGLEISDYERGSLETRSKRVKEPISHSKQQRKIENKHLVEVYGKDIMHYFQKSEKLKTMFLQRHEITPKLRAKMVDWMIEVMSSYKCHDETFFQAIEIMDHYFQYEQKNLKNTQLHTIGVVSMWIASKYEEIYPLRLRTLENKIAHGKISQDEMKSMETIICQVLGFKFEFKTIYQQCLLLSEMLELDILFNQKQKGYYERVLVYLSKMIMYDYKLLTNISKSNLVVGIIFVAFKIIEQIHSVFPTHQKAKEIVELTGSSDEILYDVAQKILNLAKNFDSFYPNFENLKKFNGFQLEQ